MYADPSGTSFWSVLGDICRFITGIGIGTIGLLFTILTSPLYLIPGAAIIPQFGITMTMYGNAMAASALDSEIKKDMDEIKWNPFNSNVNAAANSTYISFYKGMPVLRTNGNSFSFGVIVLTKDSFYGTSGHYWTPEDILKHEWGHGVQQIIYGAARYLTNIAIPSALIDNDDNAPWEITADKFGGVTRPYNQGDVKRGWQYFGLGPVVAPYWWW
jgi:hypothetical protein